MLSFQARRRPRFVGGGEGGLIAYAILTPTLRQTRVKNNEVLRPPIPPRPPSVPYVYQDDKRPLESAQMLCIQTYFVRTLKNNSNI